MGKTSHVHGLENSTIKMGIIPEEIYRFNSVPVKSPVAFFGRNGKIQPSNSYGIIRGSK